MARPVKKGLDYFPLDVDFFNDIKLKKMSRSHGAFASHVYVALLCKIYENGYYLQWDDDAAFVLSDITGATEEEVQAIVKDAAKYGLFDRELLEKHQVLTSKSIQARYFEAVKRRLKADKNMPYILRNDECEEKLMSTETELMSTETELMSTETELMSTETPQINILKIKGKERKEKENDVVVKENGIPTTTTTTTDLELKKTLREDPDWQETIRKTFKVSRADVEKLINDFFLSCSSRGKTHTDLADAKRHFCDWLRKSGAIKALPRSDNTHPINYRSVWDKTNDELCYSLTEAEAEKTFARLRFESFDNGTLVLRAESADVVEEIEGKYLQLFSKALAKNFKQKIKVKYRILN